MNIKDIPTATVKLKKKSGKTNANAGPSAFDRLCERELGIGAKAAAPKPLEGPSGAPLPPALVKSATMLPVEVAVADLTIEDKFKNLFPRDESAFDALQVSMRERGWDSAHPIHVWRREDRLEPVDGNSRVELAKQLGIKTVSAYIHDFPDENAAVAFAIAAQTTRRNLTDQQIFAVVGKMDERYKPGEGQIRIQGKMGPKASTDAPGKSAAGLAKKLDTSPSMIERCRYVHDHGDAELKAKIMNGKLSVNAAAETIRRAKKKAEREGDAASEENGELAPLIMLNDRDIAFAAWNPVTRSVSMPSNASESKTIDLALAEDLDVSFTKKQLKPFRTEVGHLRVWVSREMDIFSTEVPASDIRKILVAAEDAPSLEFLFWTRNPSRMGEFAFPVNARVGVRVGAAADLESAKSALTAFQNTSTWLWIEQITMPLEIDWLDQVDWVVVTNPPGTTAMAAPDALESLLLQARAGEDARLFFGAGVACRPVDPPREIPTQEGGLTK